LGGPIEAWEARLNDAVKKQIQWCDV